MQAAPALQVFGRNAGIASRRGGVCRGSAAERAVTGPGRDDSEWDMPCRSSTAAPGETLVPQGHESSGISGASGLRAGGGVPRCCLQCRLKFFGRD